jgi:OCT family organic cation transporter-like MFS transporter 4/5
MVYYWILPESIRWLLARGRKSEAVKILRKVAKENKVNLDEEVYENLCEESSKTPAANIFQVFRYRRLGFRDINIFFSWFVNSGVYYGLSLNTSNLGGNDYLNFFISGAVEVPAYTFLLLCLNTLGRKFVLCGCMLAGGIAMSACALVPDDMTWLLITFSMIGKCCITASYGVIYILTAENFPTVVRNAGVGTSSMFARVGGILSYYVLALKVVWKPLPLLIFGGLSVSGGLLALLIPETLGKRLPETLEDGNKFGTSAYEDTKREADSLEDVSDIPNGKEVIIK